MRIVVCDGGDWLLIAVIRAKNGSSSETELCRNASEVLGG